MNADEIEIRWRIYQETLYYGHTAPEPHNKFFVEYKRKTVRRPRWWIARRRIMERLLQGGASVA
jgi:hypothetical protein